MASKNKKQFGVWMDSHHAIIVGQDTETESFTVIGHVNNGGAPGNSNENAANNHEASLLQKFFKEIAAVMVNIDELHLTGTGQVQEQFIKFLADTPQYKNTKTTESTSNKMGESELVEYVENFYA